MSKFIVLLTIALLGVMFLAGCSGSGWMTVGGSGAFYNPNADNAADIVDKQPTQTMSMGKAYPILPMVGGGK